MLLLVLLDRVHHVSLGIWAGGKGVEGKGEEEGSGMTKAHTTRRNHCDSNSTFDDGRRPMSI